jgi:hypothetical protein
MSQQLRDTFQRLKGFSETLALTAKRDLVYVEEVLEGDGKLQCNCPSRNALALLEFRGIEQAFEEVQAAVIEINQALRR